MYRTSSSIEETNALLATWFPSMIKRIILEPSVQGQAISAIRLRMGSPAGSRPGVLLVGGMHARELMNPDMLVDLSCRLLVSYLNETDLVLGSRIWSFSTLRAILESLNVYILPNANPDGRDVAMSTNRMWRKNLRDNPDTTCDGVDVNRNFDLLWGIQTLGLGQLTTSRTPCSDQFVGNNAFSEPEARNVQKLLDRFRIECLLDIHSFSELIIHPWGHAPNQTAFPNQRFNLVDTSGWNTLPTDAPSYREYISPRDLQRFRHVALNAQQAIRDVRGRVYSVIEGNALYPTTGTSSDYAYSRHIADPTKRKVLGLAFETGPDASSNPVENFQPSNAAEQRRIQDEAASGVLAVLESCICGIDFIGAGLGDESDVPDAYRGARDKRLALTDAGRQWIELFESHQTELVGLLISDPKLLREAGAVLEAGARLLRDDENLSDELIRPALEFLSKLGKRKVSGLLRKGLKLAASTLPKLRGKSATAVVDHLTKRPPGKESRKARGG